MRKLSLPWVTPGAPKDACNQVQEPMLAAVSAAGTQCYCWGACDVNNDIAQRTNNTLAVGTPVTCCLAFTAISKWHNLLSLSLQVGAACAVPCSLMSTQPVAGMD